MGAPGLERSVYVAVALLSAGVLVLQIALNRVFSFTTWHHLAYISVSFALLGFGASGSVLAAFPSLRETTLPRGLGLYAALAAITTLLAAVLVGAVPLHLRAVASDPAEVATLALYFVGVSAPFFFAGLAIALALREAGPLVNRLYAWDLVGAGLGCGLAVAVLNVAGAPRALVLVAIAFAAAGCIAAGKRAASARNASVAALVAGAALLVPLPAWLPFPPGDDKIIAPFTARGRTYDTRWTALFRTDLIGGAGGELVQGGYHTMGRSPRFEGEGPPYRMIFHDGGAGAILYAVEDGDLSRFEMFRHHVLTTPYLLLDAPEVLVIGLGGGADVVNAFVNGARRVTGIELDPYTLELVRDGQREFTGGFFDRPDVTLVASEGRHYLRSTPERFDLVQLTGVDTLAALSSGAYILAENYLYTVRAFEEYLTRLRPGGLLSISAADYHHHRGTTRHALRFASLAAEALRARGVAQPHAHVAIVSENQRSALFEMLVALEPFGEEQLARLERFVDEEALEAWYLPGRPEKQLEPFRRLLESGPDERDAFLAGTFLNLTAPTDDRPFFFSFYKWRHLLDHRDEIDPGHLLATGQLALVLILALAIGFSLVAIELPLWRAPGDAKEMPAREGFLGYFAALGAGFIFAEISFVQRFLLFLGYPTYSLSVILFSFLTAAGVGAWWSGRLADDPARVLPRLAAALTAIVLLYLLVTPYVFDALLAAPLAVRVLVTVALCAPLGATLGTFFPYAIRLTSAISRDFSAWAWAVNGCLTVVGSVLAIIIATAWGFTAVLLLVIAIYWLGVASFLRAYRVSGASPT